MTGLPWDREEPKATGMASQGLLDDMENVATEQYLALTVTERYASMRERAFREGVRTALFHLDKLHVISIEPHPTLTELDAARDEEERTQTEILSQMEGDVNAERGLM